MLVPQNVKAGARDGRYHFYTKDVATEVKILQARLNQIGFNVGIIRPTKQEVKFLTNYFIHFLFVK